MGIKTASNVEVPVVVTLDKRASATPDRVYCQIPRERWETEGFMDVSYAMIARAINRLAFWLDAKLGKAKDDENIAYAGASDLRYVIMVFACMKTGRGVLCPDFVMTTESRLKLIDNARCTAFLVASGVEAKVEHVKADRPNVTFMTIPSLTGLLEEGEVPHYHYEPIWHDIRDKTILICHTSGTTGTPKLNAYTFRSWNQLAAARAASEQDPSAGRIAWLGGEHKKTLTFMAFPWITALAIGTQFAVHFEEIPVLIPADLPQPLKAEQMLSIVKMTKPYSTWFTPVMLREVVKYPGGTERLCKVVHKIVYTGAPLEEWIGDELIKHGSIVQSSIGSTETGAIFTNETEPKDWQWLWFHPCIGPRMEPQDDGTGTYELVFDRAPEKLACQVEFQIYPHLQVWHTKDLFIQHPEKPHLFKSVGRKDDFLKLSTMAKLYTSSVETQLARMPGVMSVFYAGDGRDEACLLVELDRNAQVWKGMTDQQILDNLWPMVDQVSKTTSKEVMIRKNMILLSDSTRPFARLTKGTVNRRRVLEDYKEDIELLYQTRQARVG